MDPDPDLDPDVLKRPGQNWPVSTTLHGCNPNAHENSFLSQTPMNCCILEEERSTSNEELLFLTACQILLQEDIR